MAKRSTTVALVTNSIGVETATPDRFEGLTYQWIYPFDGPQGVSYTATIQREKRRTHVGHCADQHQSLKTYDGIGGRDSIQ